MNGPPSEVSLSEARESFVAAANWFAGLVAMVSDGDWDQPGLGDWNLRSLVGHASRALITVDTYLDRPVAKAVVTTPWAYYQACSAVPAADPDAVVERGRQAGLALGADPAGAVANLVERVVGRLGDDDPVIETIVGGMRLSAYLPTRTFELVVHGYDLVTALDRPALELAETVIAEVVALAGRLAVADGRGPDVLLALTGRRALPASFSVV